MALWLRTVVTALGAAVASPAVRADVAPLAVYGGLPNIEEAELSPDGTRIALLTTKGDDRILSVIAIAEHKQVAAFKTGSTKVRALKWAGNGLVLIETSMTGVIQGRDSGFYTARGEQRQLFVWDLATREARNLMNFPLGVGDSRAYLNVVGGAPKVRVLDGTVTVFVPGYTVVDGLPQPGLFKIDPLKRSATVVSRGEYGRYQWLLDAAGNLVATDEFLEGSGDWTIKTRDQGHLKSALSGTATITYPTIAAISPDATSIWVRQPQSGNDRHWEMRTLRLGDTALGDVVQAALDVRAPLVDPNSDRAVGFVHFDPGPKYVLLDPQLAKRWDLVAKALDGMDPRLISASDGYRRLIVLARTPTEGMRFLMVDLESVAVTPVGDLYKGLTTVATVRPIEYAAGDGMAIPGFLTLPPGREPKGLPLIVLVHGGPAAHDDGEFDWWSQALATQGYAVLQANFRGSDLSPKFEAAGFGEWGRKMQTDLSDGIRHLAGDGLIDPQRVCIVGASYGGYAALAGVTLQTDVYRCAVAVAGVADPAGFLRWLRDSNRGNVGIDSRYLDRFMGVSGSSDQALAAISPLAHANALQVPVLLIHGKDDTVVPFAQSQAFEAALGRAHKPQGRVVVLDQEDHYLSRSATRRQMLEACVAFLRENNPP